MYLVHNFSFHKSINDCFDYFTFENDRTLKCGIDDSSYKAFPMYVLLWNSLSLQSARVIYDACFFPAMLQNSSILKPLFSVGMSIIHLFV